jgi:hypothetical protein
MMWRLITHIFPRYLFFQQTARPFIELYLLHAKFSGHKRTDTAAVILVTGTALCVIVHKLHQIL